MNINETIEAVLKDVFLKARSNLLGTFILWWMFFNWQFVASLFFSSEEIIYEKTGLLKHEYLRTLLPIDGFYLSEAAVHFLQIAGPFILTWLAIWYFKKWFFIPAARKRSEFVQKQFNIKINEKIKNRQKEIELEKLL